MIIRLPAAALVIVGFLVTTASAPIGSPRVGPQAPAAQQTQNLDAVEIKVLPAQGSVYMLVGAGGAGGPGGNVTVQVGQEGVLLVDTQYAPLSGKILAAIRTL